MEDNGPAQHLLWPEAPGKRHRKGPPAVGEQHRQVSGVVRVRLLLRVEMSPGAIKGDIASGAAAAQRMDMQGKKAVPRQPGGPRDQQSTLLPGIEQDFSQQTGIGAVSTQHSAERRDALQQDLGQGRMSTVHGKRLQSYPSVCGPAPSRTNQNRTSRVRLILFPSHDYAARAALFHRTAVYIGGTRPIRTANAAPAGAVEAAGQNKTASTGETGTGLVPLTEQAAANLATGKNNIVARTINDIVSFVKNARSKKGGSERLYMGTIPDSAARLIRDQTGVEVSGYTAILPGSSVQHIFKNHGDTQKEATRGQRAVSAEDIAQIPKVLASPDAVTLSEDTDVFGRPVLLFSKQIGDTYITAQAVTDGRHMLATNTLWIQKKKNPLVTESNAAKRDPAHNAQSVPPSGSSFESTPSEMNADETAPVPTSKTPEPVLPTAPIIADSSAKGNTQYAQNSVGQTGAIPAAERVQANGFDTPSTLSETELRSAFGENGAAAYRLGWRGDVDETDYYMAFSHAYNGARADRRAA